MASGVLKVHVEFSNTSWFLACGFCLPSPLLTFLLSSSLILSGGFFCWLLFRGRYEPGQRGNTFLWTVSGVFCAIIGVATIPFVWTGFFACWLRKLYRQSLKEKKGILVGAMQTPEMQLCGDRVSLPNETESKHIQDQYGFNRTLLTITLSALLLKLVLFQFGCRGWISW